MKFVVFFSSLVIIAVGNRKNLFRSTSYLLIFCFFKALGSPASDGNIPFVVSITDLMRYTDHVASGSIVSNRFVLTNAAYVADSFVEPWHLNVVGNIPRTWDRSDDFYAVEEIIAHPNFVQVTNENDIALLKTSSIINFHERVQPIALSSFELTNQDAVISGFGFTEEWSRMYAPLINVDFRTISNEECKVLVGDQADLVFDSKACVLPRDDRVICNNDNGSPLTVNNQVIGLSSWDIPCVPGSPIIVERVFLHLDFIQSNIE